MSEQIRIHEMDVTCMDVNEAIQVMLQYLGNEHLNTVGIITRNALIQAAEGKEYREMLRSMEMRIVGEPDILEAVGIRSGQIYDEVSDRRYFGRLLWKIAGLNLGLYIVCQEKANGRMLRQYLQDNYADIRILGVTEVNPEGEVSADGILNEMNSTSPDVILSGLDGYAPDLFLWKNQSKVAGKIWVSIGGQNRIREEAGIKMNWWESKKQKRRFRQIMNSTHEKL